MQTRRRSAAAVLPMTTERVGASLERGGADATPVCTVAHTALTPSAPAAKRRVIEGDGIGGNSSTASGGKSSLVVDIPRMAFLRDGDVLHRLSENTVDIIKGMFPDTPLVDVYIGNGYPKLGSGRICEKRAHLHIAEHRRESDITYWIERGYPADSCWCVMHLDDNPMNFNVENLRFGPAEVNSLCKKPLGVYVYKSRGLGGYTMYRKAFAHGGVRKFTKVISTITEAYHAYDCLKISMVPVGVRDFIFEYGLIRPPEYEEHYTTPDGLVDRYVRLYTPRICKMGNRPAVKSTMRIIQQNEWCPEIVKSIDASGEPFNADMDVVVQSENSRGIIHQTVVEKRDYHEHMKDGKCSPLRKCSGQGYMHIGIMRLHRIILGFKKTGESHLHGCHGPGGKLDNRRRMLRIDTASGNNRDRPKKPTATSKHRGVSAICGRAHWSFNISMNGKVIHAYAKTEEKAALISKEVYARINELEQLGTASANAEVKKIAQRVRAM